MPRPPEATPPVAPVGRVAATVAMGVTATPPPGGWVRYGMWDRWRDLTRFRVASEMALASYRTYVDGFPITADGALTVRDPSGESNFKCDLDDFRAVLADGEALYRTIFPSHVALVEDLARELVERLVAGKGVERARFAGMPTTGDLADDCERYITGTPVEQWGEAILKAGGRGWSAFKGGKRGVVEAVTVRNLCAHGIPVYNRKAVNRIALAGGKAAPPAEGERIRLDKAGFAARVSTLRLFARAMAQGVTSLPDTGSQTAPDAASH